MPADRPLRLAVTGRNGQVTRALQDRAGDALTVLTLARPEFDLAAADDATAAFAALAPDVIVNAGAYTAVDKAETDYDAALAVNGRGAGRVAQAASGLGVPVIQISTDYVYDGTGMRAYREDDPVAPVNAYGRSKLAGEEAVRAAAPNHVILRTSWVYSPYGANFMLTMLRLAGQREELRVVDDQHGAPTSALDIAAAVETVARNLVARPGDAALRGSFHFANAGETSWAGFAAEIFRLSAAQGGPSARVVPIPASDYPTPARRPANSRLDLTRIGTAHGIVPRPWSEALRAVMALHAAGLPARPA